MGCKMIYLKKKPIITLVTMVCKKVELIKQIDGTGLVPELLKAPDSPVHPLE